MQPVLREASVDQRAGREPADGGECGRRSGNGGACGRGNPRAGRSDGLVSDIAEQSNLVFAGGQ
jgi:hypothetical protein